MGAKQGKHIVSATTSPTGKHNIAKRASETIPPTIYMIAGYTGTGKDHLYRQLTDDSIKWDWSVLGIDNNIKFPKDLLRLSFADSLKADVADKYGFSLEEIEIKKNTNDIVHGKHTMRQLLIDEATKNRKSDPNYYIKKALKAINPKRSYMITDWRFVNEYEQVSNFCNVNNGMRLVTLRVFRSVTAVPTNIESENSLDAFCTDFVFLAGKSVTHERCKFARQFPQYGYYTELEFLMSRTFSCFSAL